jgi:2-methylisocitrate lyase-like PEP mutase family enzyme
MSELNLRKRLEADELLCAMGVYDAFTAKIVEESGFECLYMTGYGVSAGNFAYPDIGLVTMAEMVEVAKRITDRTSIPLFADADTGYGNAINIIRTVKEYENAGVRAIQLEDQKWPKRCGHMDGKSVIPIEEMRSKIIAAVDSRESEDTLIIARTDILALEGFDAAIERGNLFAEWGADIVFVEAPGDIEQVRRIPGEVNAKTLINLAPRTPDFSTDEIEEMGFALAIYPGVCITAAYTSCIEELQKFKETGRQNNLRYWTDHFDAMNDMLGLSKFRALETKYN